MVSMRVSGSKWCTQLHHISPPPSSAICWMAVRHGITFCHVRWRHSEVFGDRVIHCDVQHWRCCTPSQSIRLDFVCALVWCSMPLSCFYTNVIINVSLHRGESWRWVLMWNNSTSAGTSLEGTPMFAHVTLHRTFNPLGSKWPWWQMRKQLLKDHNFINNLPIFIIESSTFNIYAFQKALIQYISIWKIV